MNLQPLHDNVLLEPIKAEAQTTSGFFIPEGMDNERFAKANFKQALDATLKGDMTVLSSGKSVTPEVHAGIVVWYDKRQAVPIGSLFLVPQAGIAGIEVAEKPKRVYSSSETTTPETNELEGLSARGKKGKR